MQDYEKHGVYEMKDKQALFRLIQSLGSSEGLGLDSQRYYLGRVIFAKDSACAAVWKQHDRVRVCFRPASGGALVETALVDLEADDSDFLTEVNKAQGLLCLWTQL